MHNQQLITMNYKLLTNKARAKWDEGAFSPELVAPIPTRAFLVHS